jgi:hypothetical protein
MKPAINEALVFESWLCKLCITWHSKVLPPGFFGRGKGRRVCFQT